MLTRRGFLKAAGGVSAAAVGLGLYDGEIVSGKEQGKPITTTPDLPWPYVELDEEETRKRGYEAYFSGCACCAGAFYAIISQLKEKVKYPYTFIPMDMMFYGAGGAGVKSLCGALNGSAAAMNLAAGTEKIFGLEKALIEWYETTELPTGDFEPKSVAGSPLCYDSVYNWCEAWCDEEPSSTGCDFDECWKTDKKRERCARVVGDTAAKAVELLNAELIYGEDLGAFGVPPELEGCLKLK